MPSYNPVDYGADPCGLRNSAWAISECLNLTGKCHFPVGTFLIGSSPGAKIINRSRTGGVATFNTSTAHGLVVGERITLFGFTDTTFNGPDIGNPATFYGFRVDSTPSSTTFTATVPGANSGLVVEDGWINLIGGAYTSSILLGYGAAINNMEITGQGAGKTILKFADHTSTKIFDLYGFNAQMIKTIGTTTGSGVVGALGSVKGNPTDATNCKNTLIQGITVDGNYRNNSVADVKISSVQRTNGINTYNSAIPISFPNPYGILTQFSSQAPPAYTPPIPPLYANVGMYQQYISNVVTTGPSSDATFVGYGQIQNITQFSFERDVGVVLIQAKRNAVNQATYTRHPNWYFPFTIGNSFDVIGFSNATLNGTFVVVSFPSITEVLCVNVGPTTTVQINAFERLTNVAIYDTGTPHGFVGGENVLVQGVLDPSFNGTFVTLAPPSPTQFTCTNIGTDVPVTPSPGTVDLLENGRAWSAPNVALTPQVNAGVNSVYTIAGINHTGENALIQDCEFYDFGDGTLNAESFVLKTFLPMTVENGTPGAKVLRNKFGYQGSNSIQGTLYVGNAEAITEVVVGGFSSLLNPINVVSKSAGVATYTCVMKHTLRVGDVVVVTIPNYIFQIVLVKRQANVVTFTASQKHLLVPGNSVLVNVNNITFNGTFIVSTIVDDFSFTAAQVAVNVFPAISVFGYGSVNLFSGTLTVLSTPDFYQFTAAFAGANVLPGLYLDGYVMMLRSRRIFASDCVVEENQFISGPYKQDNQSPLHAVTVRETIDAEVRYNNFNGYSGTCFYVDSFFHKGTHLHHNEALNVGAFIALQTNDYYATYLSFGVANPELYSTFTAVHKNMVVENNDVLLSGPDSWHYQPAYPPINAPFLINNHDVDKSIWYYPTDYQIPITTATRLANITTFTTASAHELQPGFKVTVLKTIIGSFIGKFTVIATPTTTTFTVFNIGVSESTTGGLLGIDSPVDFPWEIQPIGFQRTAGVATYTTNKAHQLLVGYHATVEGLSDVSFNDEVIVTGIPTLTTFTCASPGPNVAFTSSTGNFLRYVENIQIGCNTVRRLSGDPLVINNGGRFATFFISGRSSGCVAPLNQFFYFDCPEACLALECDPGPCKPNDYLYRI